MLISDADLAQNGPLCSEAIRLPGKKMKLFEDIILITDPMVTGVVGVETVSVR